MRLCSSRCFFFFFQAEDGIRDLTVTGVQTCALPIFVIQGSSQNSVNAAPQASASAPGMASAQSNANIDPLKEADIRSLMELPGARDMVADGANNAIEQAREKLLSTVPNNDKGQAFVNAFATSYEKRFDADQVTDELVSIYDKHFTEDEIKGLLQFYGSPLGQK